MYLLGYIAQNKSYLPTSASILCGQQQNSNKSQKPIFTRYIIRYRKNNFQQSIYFFNASINLESTHLIHNNDCKHHNLFTAEIFVWCQKNDWDLNMLMKVSIWLRCLSYSVFITAILGVFFEWLSHLSVLVAFYNSNQTKNNCEILWGWISYNRQKLL